MANRTNDLTPKQAHFARCVASGLTLSDSYREAYKAGRMQPHSICVEASKLMAHPEITLTVERLQKAKERSLVASAVSDRELVFKTLREKVADGDGDAIKLRAAELLGKTIGMFKDVQVQETPRSTEQIEAKLAELLAGIEPENAMH